MNLPRLTARNATEARAQLRERRAILLAAADELADRASLFVGHPVADDILAEARSLFAQAERCAL